MIREELRQLKTEPRDLRKFAFAVGGMLLLLALWFFFRQKSYAWYLLLPAAPLLLLGWVRPRSLRRIYLGWMTLALLLGHAVSTVLLVVFFFLIVTPVGLLARALGKDFLNRKIETAAPSYWLPRDRARPRAKSDYEQQF